MKLINIILSILFGSKKEIHIKTKNLYDLNLLKEINNEDVFDRCSSRLNYRFRC